MIMADSFLLNLNNKLIPLYNGLVLFYKGLDNLQSPLQLIHGPVSYTHLDVYKRQLSDRTGHGDKREQIFYRNTNKLSLAFAGERSWRICFNGSLSVKRIELLYSVVKEHERRKSSFLYTALEKSRSVTNLQNFSLFLHHIGKESVILLSW